MIADVARHLHQSIDEVEEWDPEKLRAYHAAAVELLRLDAEVRQRSR